MHYREFHPRPRLGDFVKCFWTLRHDYSQGVHTEEQLPPKGEMELIFHYGHRFVLHAGADPIKQSANFVIGQQERFFVLRSGGETGLVAARFHPWGAYPFLGLPISELTGQFVPLEAIWGNFACELENSLAECGAANAVPTLEALLLSRLRNFEQKLNAVVAVVRRIVAQRGCVRVAEILRGQSLGLRQLERRFNEVVGLPPKRLARIIRFHSALESIYAHPRQELTRIAYDHGYSDQAHFIHECKVLSGKAPSIVRREAAQELPPEFDVEFLQSAAAGSR
jgi:methylphosphotriester-DNA--protein-cysteine methyltransferase